MQPATMADREQSLIRVFMTLLARQRPAFVAGSCSGVGFFAGEPAPTGTAQVSAFAPYLWERARPRRNQPGGSGLLQSPWPAAALLIGAALGPLQLEVELQLGMPPRLT